MNDKVRAVFVGWLELSDDERRELAKEIAVAERKPGWEQRLLKEQERTAVKHYLGPVERSCPCCGR